MPSSLQNSVSLNETARREFEAVADRFEVEPGFEMKADQNAVIVRTKLRAQQVPPLRLVVPSNYPNGTVTVDRAVLDLG